VGRLGFYSDDWFFWAALQSAKDQSLTGLLSWSWSQFPTLHWRPVQLLYLAVTHFAFGLHPWPYHFVNTLVLAGTAVLLYLSLRELRLPHNITLVVSLGEYFESCV